MILKLKVLHYNLHLHGLTWCPKKIYTWSYKFISEYKHYNCVSFNVVDHNAEYIKCKNVIDIHVHGYTQ